MDAERLEQSAQAFYAAQGLVPPPLPGAPIVPGFSQIRAQNLQGPRFPGLVPFSSELRRPARLIEQATAGYHVGADLFKQLEYSKLDLIEGYETLNTGARAELEALYPVVARFEDVIQRYEQELGSPDHCASDGVYCCLTDMHATLRWRFDFVRDRAVASAGSDPLDRSEADITKLHAREWLKKVAQSPLSERDLAVEKQVDTALVRLEAWNIARKWYGSNIAGPAPDAFGQGARGGGGGGGAGPASTPTPGGAAQPLRRVGR